MMRRYLHEFLAVHHADGIAEINYKQISPILLVGFRRVRKGNL